MNDSEYELLQKVNKLDTCFTAIMEEPDMLTDEQKWQLAYKLLTIDNSHLVAHNLCNTNHDAAVALYRELKWRLDGMGR